MESLNHTAKGNVPGIPGHGWAASAAEGVGTALQSEGGLSSSAENLHPAERALTVITPSYRHSLVLE